MTDPASPQQPAEQPKTSLLDELRTIGRHIDPQFLPVGNELLNVVGALFHSHDHPEIRDLVAEGKDQGKSDEEITREVSDVISPPPPEPEQVQAEQAQAAQNSADEAARLQSEVNELRAMVDRLASQQATGQQTQAAPPAEA